MNLSRNFTLQELIKSDTAIRLDINNNPNSGQIEKLKALCENILQPVRDHFGRVKVTSGFRSEQLCLKIGSSVNRQHAKAEAADFECMGTDNAELADWIYMNLDFDQLCSCNVSIHCLVLLAYRTLILIGQNLGLHKSSQLVQRCLYPLLRSLRPRPWRAVNLQSYQF